MSESSANTPELCVIKSADGRYELQEDRALAESPLYSEDLAPVKLVNRNWTTYNFAALWASMSACIPTYMYASGLIASGMNWWQALLTILIGNTIVLAPILLNSHPGTKYGIPFPVFARASYGTVGSNLPALMRALVACGWFGIQTWIGGQAINTLLSAIFPSFWLSLSEPKFDGHGLNEWFSFCMFWLLNIVIIYRGMDLLKRVQGIAAPFVMLMTTALLIWAVSAANGLGTIFHEAGKFNTVSEFMPVFIPSLTAMIGFWATLSLNMPDFTRFGKGQREQIVGQVVALPTVMTVFSAMGIVITSAAIVIYPHLNTAEIWDPIKLVSHFKDPLIVAVSMFTIAVATLAVNIAANVVSPANDFANAFPRWISFQRGGLITGVLGILAQPWKLIADPSGYIFTWLVGYSGGLGAIAGVLIVDYWLIRRCQLNLKDLYLAEGEYAYNKGWNWVAVAATLVGCGTAWSGALLPELRPLYDYGWFVGLALAGGLYFVLSPKPKAPSRLLS